MAKEVELDAPLMLSDAMVPDYVSDDTPYVGEAMDPDIAWIMGFILLDLLAFIVLCGVIGLELLGWI